MKRLLFALLYAKILLFCLEHFTRFVESLLDNFPHLPKEEMRIEKARQTRGQRTLQTAMFSWDKRRIE